MDRKFEPVMPGRQMPQPIDVAAERADVDLQAPCELGAGPLALRLEQRQERQEPGRRGKHAP